MLPRPHEVLSYTSQDSKKKGSSEKKTWLLVKTILGDVYQVIWTFANEYITRR